MSKRGNQFYFDTTIHIQAVKDCISGNNEKMVIEVLDFLGYKLGRDYFRQYPIGCKFVLDFAFVNEQVALEVDGVDHNGKKQKKIDKQRDNFLYDNNWVVIRISDKDFFGYKASFYKFLIKEVVEIRKEQFETGRLYKIDIPEFKEY